MKNRKFLFSLLLAIFIAASIASTLPQIVFAACGIPGAPACPPPSGGGGGGKKNKNTHPPIAPSTPTYPPVNEPCVTCPQALTAEVLTSVPATWTAEAALTATAKGPLVIPPTAGPVFLLPGVINVIIGVLIIGVLCAGIVLILRAGNR